MKLDPAHPARYSSAQPFPHLVLDDAFPEREVAEIVEHWPGDRPGWRAHRVGKRSHSDVGDRALARRLVSAPFVEWLGALTGIDGLLTDPSFYGGGLHETQRGGSLGLHVDFNEHEARPGLYRRLNVLVFLDDLPPAWHADLELWADRKRAPAPPYVRIAPHFNRLVVFGTSERTWHGHPHALCCPPGRSRRSLAAYYYTAEAPVGFTGRHTTIHRDVTPEAP